MRAVVLALAVGGGAGGCSAPRFTALASADLRYAHAVNAQPLLADREEVEAKLRTVTGGRHWWFDPFGGGLELGLGGASPGAFLWHAALYPVGVARPLGAWGELGLAAGVGGDGARGKVDAAVTIPVEAWAMVHHRGPWALGLEARGSWRLGDASGPEVDWSGLGWAGFEAARAGLAIRHGETRRLDRGCSVCALGYGWQLDVAVESRYGDDAVVVGVGGSFDLVAE